MDLRLVFLISLCIYTEVSTFPSNIETNQIGDGNRGEDSTSVVELMEKVDESLTLHQPDSEKASEISTDSPPSQDSSTTVEPEAKKNAPATPSNEQSVEFRLMYVPYRNPVQYQPSCGCSSAAATVNSYRPQYPTLSQNGPSVVSLDPYSSANPMSTMTIQSMSLPGMPFPSMPMPSMQFQSMPTPQQMLMSMLMNNPAIQNINELPSSTVSSTKSE